MSSQEDIQFLSSEQLHADLLELKSAFNDKLSTLGADIADNIQIDEVTVKNQLEPFNGKVEVQNDLKAEITNLNLLDDKLTTLISITEANKTTDISINNPVFIKNLGEVSDLLNKLLAKDPLINVAAPIVKVNTPKSITVGNTNPKDPIAVRLSDGSKFIEQLTQVVASGGVNISSLAKETTLQKLVGFAPGEYDNVDLVFTDSTKLILASIVYKKAGLTIATITVTAPNATTTRFAKS